MKKFLITLALVSGFALPALAQNEQADAAFCKYTAEQGMAQRDLLRTPALAIGPIAPSTGTSPQFVFGVTNSLSNDRKAGLTMQVAKQTCGLYKATTEAQMHLLYALPGIEKDVLANRLRLIDDATAKLDALIAENMKLVQAQNLTMPAVYMFTGTKIRLDESRTTALTGIASPYVPKLSDVPIRELVADKLSHEDATMKATVKLDKTSVWDVQLSAGAHRRLPSNIPDPQTNSWGGYGAFSLTYSFGHKAVSSHYDKSVEAYNEWRKTQFDDVSSQAALLERQMRDTTTAQKTQLQAMLVHDADLTQQLKMLEGVDTNNAIGFRNQILADQIMLRVNIEDEKFCIARFEQFIQDNF